MIPTTVTFYGDVGFDRSYNHIIDFSNTTERDNYFSTKSIRTIYNCAYNKPMNTIQLNCDYDEALKFTYCKFLIGSNPSHRKEIYAWVDDVVLVTDQKNDYDVYSPLIQIQISVDPIQTFMFDFNIGESFVVREHVDRFKVNEDGTRGWTLPNTSDDNSLGLEKRATDLISNLRNTYNNFYIDFATGGSGEVAYNSKVYTIIVQFVKTYGIHVCMFPVTVGDNTYSVCGYNGATRVNGESLNIRSLYDATYLSALNVDPQTVISVSIVPFDLIYSTNSIITDGDYKYNILEIPINGFTVKHTTATEYSIHEFLYFELTVESLPYKIEINKTLQLSTGLTVPVNGSYSSNYEPQLYKQPYKRVGIIDEYGVERGCLPDILANTSTNPYSLKFYIILDSIEVRLRIVPVMPNSIELDSKYWVEYDLTQLDIITNEWLSYMAQHRDADREMISSQLNQQAIASAIGGVGGAVGQGGNQAMSVGKAQAAGSSGAMALSEGGAFAGGALVGLGATAITTLGGYLANKHFAFEQQDIREKAIKRKANNISKSGNLKGIINDALRIVLIECDETTLDIKSKEFHKYGYSVFKYETPNIRTRKYFNFIATNIIKINGNLNNNIKVALMEIFNNGVTVWHGDYINELSGVGDYSKENIERSLI